MFEAFRAFSGWGEARRADGTTKLQDSNGCRTKLKEKARNAENISFISFFPDE